MKQVITPATPAAAGKTFCVLEVRRGKGPKPPFRVVGVSTTSPQDAVAQMSELVGVQIKGIDSFGNDGYVYGVPLLDGLSTQVRAKLWAVSDIAEMMGNSTSLEA